MPSPVEDRPGLLMRDSFGYSEQTLIVPPLLAHSLQYFDGDHTELDLREALVKATNDLQSGSLAKHLYDALHNAGFLEDEIYNQLRETKQRAFEDSPVRLPSHAGSAYPEDAAGLTSVVNEWVGPRNET